MSKQWTWKEYLEIALDPDGRELVVQNLLRRTDISDALAGTIPILEAGVGERALRETTRLDMLIRERALQRKSDNAVDPETGAEGFLFSLASEKRESRALLITWRC